MTPELLRPWGKSVLWPWQRGKVRAPRAFLEDAERVALDGTGVVFRPDDA